MLYPTLTKTRKVYDLGGMWNFTQESYDVTDGLLSAKEVMVVPTSFNDVLVEKERRTFIGDSWYERVVDIPFVSDQEELVLRFGSVTHRATVYVNGEKVGEHTGGFTPFEIVVPEHHLQATTFRLSVCVNNELNFASLPVGNYLEIPQEDGSIKKKVIENFDFFNYAGIHRPVKLVVRPKKHIQDITISYEVDGENETATVHVCTDVVGEGTVRITILNEEREVVAVAENDTAVIEHVKLWAPLNSYLYTCRVELTNDSMGDVYEEPFGIRTVKVENGQFLINGKPFYFKGFGKHEDTYINGRGLNEAANLMDLNLAKKIGANSFRTSHYPYSEEMMRLADRMGIVVLDEVPAVGLFQNFTAALDLVGKQPEKKNTWDIMETKQAHEQVIQELVQRDKNHACVVMWVVANEPASQEPGARAYFEPLIQQFRQLDAQNRPVTLVNIMMATPQLDEVMDLLDVICLNRYYGWYVAHGDLETARKGLKAELLEWQGKYPDKPIIMTEYGADTIPGYHSNFEVPYTEEFQTAFYKMYHEVFDEVEHFVGEHVWNFADFETNASTIIRVKGNHKGLFSRDREPKQVVQLFKERWTAIPEFDYKQ